MRLKDGQSVDSVTFSISTMGWGRLSQLHTHFKKKTRQASKKLVVALASKPETHERDGPAFLFSGVKQAMGVYLKIMDAG